MSNFLAHFQYRKSNKKAFWSRMTGTFTFSVWQNHQFWFDFATNWWQNTRRHTSYWWCISMTRVHKEWCSRYKGWSSCIKDPLLKLKLNASFQKLNASRRFLVWRKKLFRTDSATDWSQTVDSTLLFWWTVVRQGRVEEGCRFPHNSNQFVRWCLANPASFPACSDQLLGLSLADTLNFYLYLCSPARGGAVWPVFMLAGFQSHFARRG